MPTTPPRPNRTDCSPCLRLILRYEPSTKRLDAISDDLVEIIQYLPAGVRMRNIVTSADGAVAFWLILDGLDGKAEPDLIGQFASLGIYMRPASSGEIDSLLRHFPHAQLDKTKLKDEHDNELVVIDVTGGWSVTRPGMTRSLTRWLANSGRLAYLVFDAVAQPTGLARYDLTLILTVTPADSVTKTELTQLLSDKLDAETTQDPLRS